MTDMEKRYKVLIASYLEPELVERLRHVDGRLQIIFEPDLLAKPSYPADHYGVPERTPEQEARWRELLGRHADILFDFDYSHRAELPELAPQLRWVQAGTRALGSSSSAMATTHACPAPPSPPPAACTPARWPSSALMAMLMHYKQALPMLGNRQRTAPLGERSCRNRSGRPHAGHRGPEWRPGGANGLQPGHRPCSARMRPRRSRASRGFSRPSACTRCCPWPTCWYWPCRTRR